ncbi:MAG: zinc ribbon domain-containing protein [Ruminococcaceae bacterium]|nr:zinc ribbon domain-containing protein [Oscillospiraceae bacterium]
MKYCDKCGCEINPNNCTCHKCGAKLEETNHSKAPPMKWHNFLIKGGLIFFALDSLALSYLLLIDAPNSGLVQEDRILPLVIFGVLSLIDVILFFFARYTLIREKMIAPKLVITSLIILSIVFCVYYNLIISISLGDSDYQSLVWIMTGVCFVIYAFFVWMNIIYFRKRKDIYRWHLL